MTFGEMSTTVEEAKRTLDNADSLASRMADLIVGRLRRVSPGTLARLKRELRSFNITTREWSE